MTATAITAFAGTGTQFKSGRHLAAWLGLVPGNSPQAANSAYLVSATWKLIFAQAAAAWCSHVRSASGSNQRSSRCLAESDGGERNTPQQAYRGAGQQTCAHCVGCPHTTRLSEFATTATAIGDFAPPSKFACLHLMTKQRNGAR
ncbi:transposase [Paraburkholderia sp. BR14320]|uniref:transposase n=1 Tax=unclassified Paraburkholderia TaxID=2615204 RepID=UPI0034CD82FE